MMVADSAGSPSKNIFSFFFWTLSTHCRGLTSPHLKHSHMLCLLLPSPACLSLLSSLIYPTVLSPCSHPLHPSPLSIVLIVFVLNSPPQTHHTTHCGWQLPQCEWSCRRPSAKLLTLSPLFVCHYKYLQ